MLGATLLSAVLLVTSVRTVVMAVTTPPVWDADVVRTAELLRRTGSKGTVAFIRSVSTVIPVIAEFVFLDASLGHVASELVQLACGAVAFTVNFIALISTVKVSVTFLLSGNAELLVFRR